MTSAAQTTIILISLLQAIVCQNASSDISPLVDDNEIYRQCNGGNIAREDFWLTIKGVLPDQNVQNGVLVNLMRIYYSPDTQLPIFSCSYLADYHKRTPLVNRTSPFRAFHCPSQGTLPPQNDCRYSFFTTKEQQEESGLTAFDRGHLTPANPFRFSKISVENTCYCVNVVPQDRYTNRGPWGNIEDNVLQAAPSGSLIITGTCKEGSIDGPTRDGYRVPDCIYKLVCSLNAQRVTFVTGNIAENKLLHKNSESDGSRQRRFLETMTTRSQRQVIARSGHNDALFAQAWREAYSIAQNDGIQNLPDLDRCIQLRDIPSTLMLTRSNYDSYLYDEESMLLLEDEDEEISSFQ